MKLEKQYHFFMGLPRSGTTLLTNIINQNSEIFATDISSLPYLLYCNERDWSKNPSVLANKIDEQIVNISTSLINTCWQHKSQKIILDRHLNWANNSSIIPKMFNENSKFIVLVRDIHKIVASILQQHYHSAPTSIIDKHLIENRKFQNDAMRCDFIFHSIIQPTYDILKRLSENNSNVLFLDYDILMEERSLNKMYNFLNIENFEHNFNVPYIKDDEQKMYGIGGMTDVSLNAEDEILNNQHVMKYSELKLEFWK